MGRRVFVGSLIAGVPALAGWQVGLRAQPGGSSTGGAADAADVLVDYVVRQIAQIHNAAHTGPRGEHALALAAQLRLLSVYARQHDVDEQVRSLLRDRIAKEGRNAVLYVEADAERRHANMARYGFRHDPRTDQSPVNPTHAMREAALDAVLKDGITPVFDGIATMAERMARPLDRARAHILSIQDDSEWWEAYCSQLLTEYQNAQLMSIPFCAAVAYGSWAVPYCVAMEGAASFLLLTWALQCGLFGI